MGVHLIQADALHLPLPDESMQMVATSPPYWGLRDYGSTPTAWGGDTDCAHEWGDASWRPTRWGEKDDDKPGDKQRTNAGSLGHRGAVKEQAVCVKCGAWLGCYGLEPTPDLYIAHTVTIFREVRRVLRADGTLWLNLGDCYASSPPGCKGVSKSSTLHGIRGISEQYRQTLEAGHGTKRNTVAGGLKPKDLANIPHRVVMALQADGWWHRDTIIWAKPNPMPSSVTDRTTTAHEYVFLLTKAARYFYDADAIREPVTSTGGASFGGVVKGPALASQGKRTYGRRLEDGDQRNHPLGRNKRSVWTIPTQSFHGAHFATFPTRLVEPMIRAGTSEKGCCRACGAPWRRVVDKTYVKSPVHGPGSVVGRHYATGANNWDGAGLPRVNSHIVTTGWIPGCKCNSGESVPCRVLDCFNGAGTTIMVADRLGRVGIGCDLKFDYLAMSRERVKHDRQNRHAKKPRSRPRRERQEVTLFG